MSDDPLLKVSEVAELLNVSPTTVRRWLTTGVLPGLKLRKRWRVRKSEADAMLTRHDRQDDEAAKPRKVEPILNGDEAYLASVGIKFEY